MKKKLNRGYLEISIYLSITVCIGILFTWLLFNSEGFFAAIGKIFAVLRPILVGFILAYLLLPLVHRIQRQICTRLLPRCTRTTQYHFAIFLTYVLLGLMLYAVFTTLLPRLVTSVVHVLQSLRSDADRLAGWLAEICRQYSLTSMLGLSDAEVYSWAYNMLHSTVNLSGEDMTAIIGQAIGLASTLMNSLISLVISVYVLLDASVFKTQFKRLLYAIIPTHSVNFVVKVLKDADRMYSGFVSGKFIDSLIIGILCFFFMTVLKIPEAVPISTIVGVTNMIPTFGPFIGGIPCVLMMLVIDYRHAITLALLIIALQQFDGNILGPKILGDSLGISAFWVVFSVVVAGGLFGVWGMFFGVPIFAVL
ncbi:MAG: AI-2E family transporter, partial [Clostridia bacterium]|nr:AI-2E family transporter [Clostridia bacterium]